MNISISIQIGNDNNQSLKDVVKSAAAKATARINKVATSIEAGIQRVLWVFLLPALYAIALGQIVRMFTDAVTPDQVIAGAYLVIVGYRMVATYKQLEKFLTERETK